MWVTGSYSGAGRLPMILLDASCTVFEARSAIQEIAQFNSEERPLVLNPGSESSYLVNV